MIIKNYFKVKVLKFKLLIKVLIKFYSARFQLKSQQLFHYQTTNNKSSWLKWIRVLIEKNSLIIIVRFRALYIHLVSIFDK